MHTKGELITSGSGDWTIPTGCKMVWVTMCGGGAGGGGGIQITTEDSYEYAAGGGGGGAESIVNAPVVFLPTDTVIPYSVGAGGAGGEYGIDYDAEHGENGGSSVFGRIIAAGGYAEYLLGHVWNNGCLSGTSCVFGASADGGGKFGRNGTPTGGQTGQSPDSPNGTFFNGGASSGSGGRGASNSGSGGRTNRYAGGVRGAYVNGRTTGGAGGGASHFGPGGEGKAGGITDDPVAPSGYGGGGSGGCSTEFDATEPGNGGPGADGFILICWIE